MLSAAAEAGASLQTSACTPFSWNQSGFGELLAPFRQIAIPVIIDLTCFYLTGHICQNIPVRRVVLCLVLSACIGKSEPGRQGHCRWSLRDTVRGLSREDAKTHFLLQLKNSQELLSYKLCTLAVWVGGWELCLAGETVFWRCHFNIHEKLQSLLICLLRVYLFFLTYL